jgi:hypothetical protein
MVQAGDREMLKDRVTDHELPSPPRKALREALPEGSGGRL